MLRINYYYADSAGKCYLVPLGSQSLKSSSSEVSTTITCYLMLEPSNLNVVAASYRGLLDRQLEAMERCASLGLMA